MSETRIVEDNMIEFFRHAARVRASGEVAELDGVTIASAGIDFHMFNAAFFSRAVGSEAGELDRRIALARERLGAGGRRWSFWACEEELEAGFSRAARSTFVRRGLHFAYRHPGMLSGPLRAPSRPPAKLEIRPVLDRETRLAFSHVNSVAFRIPFQWCCQLYDLDALWDGCFEGHVGYWEGEAVATAATLLHAGAAGVYGVATLPAHQGRGFAETVVRYALARATEKFGTQVAVLQSTADGMALYRRLGYRTVTHFSIFST